MRNMIKKKIIGVVLISLIGTMIFTGCGLSKSSVKAAEKAKKDLLESKNTAEEAYLDVSDTSLREKLDELAAKEKEIELRELDGLDKEELEALISEIEQLNSQYQEVNQSLSDILTLENEKRSEREKHRELEVYLINKTGLDLIEVKLHDKTKDSYSDNLLREGTTLADGYTLMGVNLDLFSDSTEWEVIIKDTNNTEHTLECGDLISMVSEGASLSLVFDAQTNSGSVQMGNYVPLQEAESSSEVSS